ncbi:MAG: quinone oxidoreductase family protein [Candidatus Hodarchaeales archaeon]|jgi:NADPH2:quinone reductase
MRAILLNKLGGPGVLRVTDVPKPSKLQENEVLVRLKAAGVNYAETLARQGLYGWVPKKKGFIIGVEGSGIVEEVGQGVTDLKFGDNVNVVGNSGCYAEYVKLPRRQVLTANKTYSFEENAAFPASFLTAYIALREMGRVKQGESLLIQAAAGSLGTATVKLAKVLGLKTAGTASQERKIEFLVDELGIDKAINYKTEDFATRINEWTVGGGVDVILESVGGRVFRESLKCLAPLGRIIVVGASSIRFSKKNPFTWWPAWRSLPRVNVVRMLGLSQGVLAFHAGRLLESSQEHLERIFNELSIIVEENEIKPVIDRVYPLEEAADAHKRLESRGNIGKIVLKID